MCIRDSFKNMNTGLNETVEGFAHLNLAFGGAIEVAKTFREALKDLGQDMRLEMSTAGVSVDRLSDAFDGLLDEDRLREFAAKGLHGALKLTQTEMETMGKAAIALRDQLGVDLKDAMQKLEDAAVSGRTRGLH